MLGDCITTSVYERNTIILHIESKRAPKYYPQCGHAHLVKVGQGKAAYALAGFWKRVRCKKLDIKYIATDLSAAFISSVLETARTPCMSSTIFMWSN